MPSEDSPAPTLASVAALAGVSIATVSKVKNGRADVGPKTRARVQTLLEQYDYVGRGAQSARPASPDQQTVEVVFHGRLSVYCLEVLEGVLGAATAAGVSVAVSVRPRERRSPGVQRSAAWVRDLMKRGRLAVVDVVDDVRHGDLSALARARLPLVVIDPLSVPRREVNSIGTTNFSGGLAATQHLLSLGHSRIAYLGADAGTYNQARRHGYRAALEAAEVSVPNEYVRLGSGHYEAGVEGGAALLRVKPRPTAIFAVTDDAAAGVIEAARLQGLRVPEDVSVVGFDDTTIARLLSPPLTTVRQPLREMGQVALRTALRLAAGEQLDSHHVELAAELVVRSSTAKQSN